eukprot:NODE_287_length_11752_cov_0.494036.p3 type:complete len:103 gc:universal NODE_287_length_11752_cov_0.494036:5022-5330(+)
MPVFFVCLIVYSSFISLHMGLMNCSKCRSSPMYLQCTVYLLNPLIPTISASSMLCITTAALSDCNDRCTMHLLNIFIFTSFSTVLTIIWIDLLLSTLIEVFL